MNNGETAIGTCEMQDSTATDNPSIINKGLINKIKVRDRSVLDLTGDTITPYDVKKGVKFHMRNGASAIGVYEEEPSYYTIEFLEASSDFYITQPSSEIIFSNASNSLLCNFILTSSEDYLVTLKISKNDNTSFVNPKITCKGGISGTMLGTGGANYILASSASMVMFENSSYSVAQRIFNNEQNAISNKDISVTLNCVTNAIMIEFYIKPPIGGYEGSYEGSYVLIHLNDLRIDGKRIGTNEGIYLYP